MQRLIFIIFFFFLISCSFEGTKSVCPFVSSPSASVVNYEYSRTDVNPEALEKIKNLARNASENNKRVCIVGRIAHPGNPRDNLYDSLNRAKDVAGIFLDMGLDKNLLYVSVQSQHEKTGLTVPVNPTDYDRQVIILIDK